MKKSICMLALASVATGASAQSSVNLFGLIDAGVTYVSNEGGSKNFKFDDGIFTPNLFGLQGSEDLGGGNHAIFRLVNQFSLGSGAMIGGGIFAREAYVGLQNDRFGSIKLGNQYDFMVDSLFGSVDTAMDLAGLYGARNGPFQKLAIPDNPTGAFDWDRVAGSNRVANSVKYTSANLGGFTGGAMYGFGNIAGSIGANNTVSAGLNYAHGPFAIGAAYTNEKYGPVGGVAGTSVRNWGVGTRYVFGAFTTKVLFTTVRNSINGGGIWMGQAGGVYQITPALSLGASYAYMKGNAELDDNHAHQVSAALQYSLSKRTLVYVAGVYQRANSGANAQINGVLDPNGASSGATQALARIGINTKF
ncbi:porin [Paraburkholderia sp. Ac-20342]|uniref:porin n=1 Tax=unclassified Paraburkholderia TaxID=2615204 RepID=UPI001420B0D6|nr:MULTISPECIES: porin [unclassified Paraburkholderia]MBN3849743.1 porin [Paraburkholderia sp. Ac-20342]NIF80609.1 porin [Paraburkholderia sp. Cy-641]